MSGTPVSLKVESLVREALEAEAGRAVFRVASGSMSPRLVEGDRIVVEKVSPRALTPGDVVVFRSEAAGIVVHRLVWRNNPLGRPTHIFTRGDALDRLDRSVPVGNVLGRVVGVMKGGGFESPTRLRDRIGCLFLAAGYGFRRWLRRIRPAAS